MSIKVKSGGAYADIVGVFHKRAGAYEAVQGVFVKDAGVYGRVDAATMALGMNVAWINSYSGAWVFSNIMYHARLERASGTGTWTQDQGVVTTTDQNDVFRFKLADHDTELPSGTYTVLNPDGLQVQIGGFSVPGTWRTDTQFTFTRPSTGGVLGLFVKGNVTNASGNLSVIAPSHLSKWQAGDIWHDDFISFHQNIACSPLRLMDWGLASTNIESNWAQRSKTNKITLYTPGAGGECVPYEFMCDLAERLNTDIWVCVPTRASQDYVTNMAALFAANLPTGRKLWLELGNELWNNTSPWGDGTNWVTYLDNTRRTAVADPAGQKFVLAGHGLTNAAEVRCFSSYANRAAEVTPSFRLTSGVACYVKVLNADEFELYIEPALTSKIAVQTGQIDLLFVVVAEPGKTAALDTHYSELCLRNWNAFDAAIDTTRIKHIVASQSADANKTTGRLAVAGVKERTDYVAIAPYFYGEWCGARLIGASGSITPGWWGANSKTVHIGVYSSGATPTIDDVMAGTGAINKQTFSYSAGPDTYTSATAVTGLTNDTTYDVHFVFEDGGINFQLIGSVAPSVGGSTVYAYDSYENQALRNRLYTRGSGVQQVLNHLTAAAGVPVVCYEGGSHFSNNAPAEMDTWIAGYQESTDFADVISHNLNCIAAAGAKMHAYYADVLGTVFSIATSFTDTSDLRYQVFDELDGKITKKNLVDIAAATPSSILTEPSFPYLVYTFPDSSLTYQIIGGDDDGNFAMVGAQLRMVNGTGVNWGSPSGKILTVEATDGFTSDAAAVSFTLGDAWYAADAKFVWDSTIDASSSQVDPVIGGVLPRTAGASDAPIADSLWDMDGRTYASTTGSISTVALNVPFLIAAVMDKDNHTTGFRTLSSFGSSNFMSFYVAGSGASAPIKTRLFTTAGDDNIDTGAAAPTGKQVYWAFWDGVSVLTGGINQTNGATATRAGHAAYSIARDIDFGFSAQSAAKHGSVMVLSRSGLTLAQAKAIVAKMQTLHGIA